MSKEDCGEDGRKHKSFGAKMLAMKFGMPVWVWILDFIVLLTITKLIWVLWAIQAVCCYARWVYRRLKKKHPGSSTAVRGVATAVFVIIPVIFILIVSVAAYHGATMTPEERERFDRKIAERNKITFLGVEIGSSIDSEQYKDYPRQYVNKGGERYYIIRVPLGRKLFHLEGFDIVNVYASVISHTIYKVELIYEEAVYTGFDEYQTALEKMMKSKFGVKPKDSSDRQVLFRLKDGTVHFRTGGRQYYSNGKVHEVGPYTTTLSCHQDDLAKLAEKEGKEVLAQEKKERTKNKTERINKAANAGVDLL